MGVSVRRKSPIGDPSLKKITIEIGGDASDEFKIDGVIFLLDANGKVSSDEDMIFFGQPEHKSKSVVYLGKTESNPSVEQFQIELDKIPEGVTRIEIATSIYEGDERQQNFSMSTDNFISVIESESKIELFSAEFKYFSIATARVIGEIYRRGSEWKFKNLNAEFSGGIFSLCKQYGVEIDDSPQENSMYQINLERGQKFVLRSEKDRSLGRIAVSWNGSRKLCFICQMQDNSILERACELNLDSEYICDDVSMTEKLLDNAKRILIYSSDGEFVLFLRHPSISEIRILVNHSTNAGFCTIAMLENLDSGLIVENIVEHFETEEEIKKSHKFIAEQKIEHLQTAVDQLQTQFSTQQQKKSKKRR